MDYNMKELQDCQMEILKELERVCKKNDIKYFLVFGTCLGAIRHKGFIPWDDDIDVGMSIDDFKKLKQCSGDFQEKYFLQTHESDPEYGLAIGRLRNSQTTLIEGQESDRDINHGVFVDIYPFYNCPTKKFAFKRALIHSRILRLMLYQRVPKNRGKLMKIGSKILLGITPKFIRRALARHSQKVLYNIKETGVYATFYASTERVRYTKEMLFPIREVPYENTTAFVPAQAEKHLEFCYGDFMKLPPEEKRVVHHDFKYVDVHNGYLNFKGKYYCENGDKK